MLPLYGLPLGALDHLPRVEPERLVRDSTAGDELEHRAAHLEQPANRIQASLIAGNGMVRPPVIEEQLAGSLAETQLEHAGNRAIDDHLDQLAQRELVDCALQLQVRGSSRHTLYASYHRFDRVATGIMSS